ncbi:MAG: 50S ribosomal protein L25 [Deltaproteobacteria bacterium]|nr:50S ribosomal protein L25 [Deltaproteobacteria bacterium]
MEQVNLSALSRDTIGTKPSGRLRRNGRVPAVLYGPAMKGALAFSLDAKELDKALHGAAGGNVLVNLDIGGGKGKKTAMFKAISHHPVSGAVRHIDMIEVVMDRKVVIDVPVHITGRAQGQALGGIIQLEARKVRVECLPVLIPQGVDVDVTLLGIGQSLHLKDLHLALGIRIIGDMNTTVVSVVAPTVEVAPKTAEEVKAELDKSFEEKEKPKEEEEKEK